jgi:hypothetical protein
MKNKQRGFTLIEAASAMLIGSLMLIGVTAMIDASMEDSKGQQAAMYQAQVVAAATKYINNYANYNAQLTKLTPAVLPNSVVPITDLVLPATMAPTNVYGQTPCVVVKLRPSTTKLDVLVVTQGGNKILPKDIAAIAAQAGPGNGYILDATPTTTKARGASWALDTAALGGFTSSCLTGTTADSGHLASALFFDEPGQLSTDFLYRDSINGRPNLNTMNTPLLMANAAVVPAADVAARTAASACPAKAIAMDDKGELLQCGSDGKWDYVSQWKAPVETYTELTNLVTKKRGDVRMVLGTDPGGMNPEKIINKAFVYDGINWVALAEDQNGELRVRNNLSVGDVSGLPGPAVKGDIRAGANLLASNDVKANHDVLANNDVKATRDVRAGQEMHAGWMIVDSSVTAESLFLNYNNDPGHFNGQECNITLWDRDGKPYKAWPVGSITAEGGRGWQRDGAGNPSIGYPNSFGANTGKTLYCGVDQHWHYVY